MTSRSYNSVTATLSYNLQNQLVEWNAGATNQGYYAYDSTGERALQRSITSSGTSLTAYAFGIEEHVYGGSGTPTSSTYYYSLGGHLIGSTNGSNTQFYLTDALGSILESFSDIASTASVLGNQAFGPYGNTQYQSGTLGTAKGFTGQYQDPSGLDYDTARYYDPVVGLFISADSVQSNQQGMNPYAYVGGNPETDTDPTGNYIAGPRGSGLSAISNPVTHGYAITDLGWDHFLNGAIFAGRPATVTTYPYVPPHQSTSSNSNVLHQIIQHLDLFDTPDPGDKNLMNDPYATAQEKANATFLDDSHALEHINAIAEAMAEATGDDEDAGMFEAQIAIINAECASALSFSYQTPVKTSHGEQDIGKLKVGQKVWAYNPKTKKMEWQTIQHVWVNHDNDLVNLTIAWSKYSKKGTKQESETIHTNKKHPFLTQEKGFVSVANLHVGMHIKRGDGSVGTIVAWVAIAGTQTMYNLTVQQDHTYTVGTGQWIVHNDDGDSCSIPWYQFDDHIKEGHVGLTNQQAQGQMGINQMYQGVWNDTASGQAYVNAAIYDPANKNKWRYQKSTGNYILTIPGTNVPGHMVSSTGFSSSATGIEIIMTGKGTGELKSAYPVNDFNP